MFKREKAKKDFVCCRVSERSGGMTPRVKRIRGHDGKNVRQKKINQNMKRMRRRQRLDVNKIADQSEAAEMKSDRRDDKRQKERH